MAQPKDSPLKLAVAWAARADMSCAELRQRLAASGVSEEEAEDVLAKMTARGFVSDERIRLREKEKAAQKGAGRLKIEAALQRRGVEPVVETSHQDQVEVALRVLDERLKPGDGPAKAARMLASRGFDEEAVKEAVLARFPEVDG